MGASHCLCSEEHSRSEQDVRNVRFATPPGVSYEAGDVAVVWPRTDPGLVRRFVVETLELNPRTIVRVRPARHRDSCGGDVSTSIFPDTLLTIEDLFSSYVDINAVPPRHFFEVLSKYTEDEIHSKKLREFASRTLEAKDELYEYCKREKRSAAEVMWDFWTARPPLPELLSCLPPMRPRRYSIASCPRWYDPSAAAEAAALFWNSYARSCGPAWRPSFRCQAAVNACAEALVQAGCTAQPRPQQDAASISVWQL